MWTIGHSSNWSLLELSPGELEEEGRSIVGATEGRQALSVLDGKETATEDVVKGDPEEKKKEWCLQKRIKEGLSLRRL